MIGPTAPAEAVLAAGADGCRHGWLLAVRLSSGSIGADVVPSFAELLRRIGAAPLAIDIPVGLPSRGARAADALARARLGPRRSSVFTAPIRPVLTAGSYAEACAIRRRVEDRAISVEAWNIIPKIVEVDALMTPAVQARVREAHPEVCFATMNGGVPARFSKKTPAGREERAALLVRNLHGAGPVLAGPRPRGTAADDVLDALAVLWTAERLCRGAAEALAEDGARDDRGLRMEIWY